LHFWLCGWWPTFACCCHRLQCRAAQRNTASSSTAHSAAVAASRPRLKQALHDFTGSDPYPCTPCSTSCDCICACVCACACPWCLSPTGQYS
jgi:hypothetical protein